MFQVSSLESLDFISDLFTKVIMGNNWEDPYNFALAATGAGSAVFFGIVVIFGNLFVQKLFLAVMESCYAEEYRIAHDAREVRRIKRKEREKKINGSSILPYEVSLNSFVFQRVKLITSLYLGSQQSLQRTGLPLSLSMDRRLSFQWREIFLDDQRISAMDAISSQKQFALG
jgi:hypothetical protein